MTLDKEGKLNWLQFLLEVQLMLQFKIACSLFAKMKSEIKMIAFKAELTILLFTFMIEAKGTNYGSCITQASKTTYPHVIDFTNFYSQNLAEGDNGQPSFL